MCDRRRTVAVLNTAQTPTARMVTDVERAPSPTPTWRCAGSTGPPARPTTVRIDATGLAQRLFGDHMPANMLLVGAAYQHGCLPIGRAAIERAIELNGAAVEANLAAFAWGRAAVGRPRRGGRRLLAPPADAAAADRLDPRAAGPACRSATSCAACWRSACAELAAYQSRRYARRYLEDVLRVAAVEHEQTGGGEAVARAYARGLHKLMAYKDEYEVARLHLLTRPSGARREAEFGARREGADPAPARRCCGRWA